MPTDAGISSTDEAPHYDAIVRPTRTAPPGSIEIDALLEEVESTEEGFLGVREAMRTYAVSIQDVDECALRSLRLARGMSQQSLSARAGMSQPQIARLERGIGDPRYSTLERLARALGVPVHDVVTAWHRSNRETIR